MKVTIILLCLCCSVSSYGQRPPVPSLPKISLADAGFNQDSINALDDLLSDTPHTDAVGMIVIKDNKIAIEYYYNSFWRNHIHDIRSAGKSITSLLLGVALKEGLVQDLDQDVFSFFSKEKYPSLHEDYKKVKIRHLLDMASGLDADSDDYQTPGHAGRWTGRNEWTKYILGIPLAEKPGKRWVYADINAALIGAIIEETSGMSLKDFANEKVFIPLDIKEFYWYTNAANQTTSAGNLYLSALDFAKLGVLVANGGKYGDQQIVQADYVEKLLERKVFNLIDYNPLADNYGMLWYKSKRDFGKGEIAYLWASGNGGNHLIVVPEKNMVIALTSGGYGQWHPHLRAYAALGRLLRALE